MSHILCPSCCELIPASARHCRHCRELLRDFRECPECRERVRAEAGTCRFCGFRLSRAAPPPLPPAASLPTQRVAPSPASALAPAPAVPAPVAAPDEDYTVGATSLGGLFAQRSISALIAPAELRLNAGVVTLRRYYGMGGSSTTERIPVSRIRDVRVARGALSGSLRIEDVGGGPALELGGLRKEEAAAMAELLKRAVGRAVRPSSPAPLVPPSAPGSESRRVV